MSRGPRGCGGDVGDGDGYTWWWWWWRLTSSSRSTHVTDVWCCSWRMCKLLEVIEVALSFWCVAQLMYAFASCLDVRWQQDVKLWCEQREMKYKMKKNVVTMMLACGRCLVCYRCRKWCLQMTIMIVLLLLMLVRVSSLSPSSPSRCDDDDLCRSCCCCWGGCPLRCLLLRGHSQEVVWSALDVLVMAEVASHCCWCRSCRWTGCSCHWGSSSTLRTCASCYCARCERSWC